MPPRKKPAEPTVKRLVKKGTTAKPAAKPAKPAAKPAKPATKPTKPAVKPATKLAKPNAALKAQTLSRKRPTPKVPTPAPAEDSPKNSLDVSHLVAKAIIKYRESQDGNTVQGSIIRALRKDCWEVRRDQGDRDVVEAEEIREIIYVPGDLVKLVTPESPQSKGDSVVYTQTSPLAIASPVSCRPKRRKLGQRLPSLTEYPKLLDHVRFYNDEGALEDGVVVNLYDTGYIDIRRQPTGDRDLFVLHDLVEITYVSDPITTGVGSPDSATPRSSPPKVDTREVLETATEKSRSPSLSLINLSPCERTPLSERRRSLLREGYVTEDPMDQFAPVEEAPLPSPEADDGLSTQESGATFEESDTKSPTIASSEFSPSPELTGEDLPVLMPLEILGAHPDPFYESAASSPSQIDIESPGQKSPFEPLVEEAPGIEEPNKVVSPLVSLLTAIRDEPAFPRVDFAAPPPVPSMPANVFKEDLPEDAVSDVVFSTPGAASSPEFSDSEYMSPQSISPWDQKKTLFTEQMEEASQSGKFHDLYEEIRPSSPVRPEGGLSAYFSRFVSKVSGAWKCGPQDELINQTQSEPPVPTQDPEIDHRTTCSAPIYRPHLDTVSEEDSAPLSLSAQSSKASAYNIGARIDLLLGTPCSPNTEREQDIRQLNTEAAEFSTLRPFLPVARQPQSFDHVGVNNIVDVVSNLLETPETQSPNLQTGLWADQAESSSDSEAESDWQADIQELEASQQLETEVQIDSFYTPQSMAQPLEPEIADESLVNEPVPSEDELIETFYTPQTGSRPLRAPEPEVADLPMDLVSSEDELLPLNEPEAVIEKFYAPEPEVVDVPMDLISSEDELLGVNEPEVVIDKFYSLTQEEPAEPVDECLPISDLEDSPEFTRPRSASSVSSLRRDPDLESQPKTPKSSLSEFTQSGATTTSRLMSSVSTDRSLRGDRMVYTDGGDPDSDDSSNPESSLSFSSVEVPSKEPSEESEGSQNSQEFLNPPDGRINRSSRDLEFLYPQNDLGLTATLSQLPASQTARLVHGFLTSLEVEVQTLRQLEQTYYNPYFVKLLLKMIAQGSQALVASQVVSELDQESLEPKPPKKPTLDQVQKQLRWVKGQVEKLEKVRHRLHNQLKVDKTGGPIVLEENTDSFYIDQLQKAQKLVLSLQKTHQQTTLSGITLNEINRIEHIDKQ